MYLNFITLKKFETDKGSSGWWIVPGDDVAASSEVLVVVSFVPGAHLLGLDEFFFLKCVGDWLQLTEKEILMGIFGAKVIVQIR